MFTPNAKQYLYNREEIEKFLHVKFLEEDEKMIHYYETESGIHGIRQVDIVYEFKKVGQYLSYYGASPRNASRTLGYTAHNEFDKFAEKRFEQLFLGCRVNMFKDYTFHLSAFERNFTVSTTYIETDFLKDAELIISLSPEDKSPYDHEIYDSHSRDFKVFYCSKRKGLFYVYKELLEFTEKFNTSKLEKLLTTRSNIFDNYSFDKSCQFFSNEDGIFVFYPYDFERYKQFNFFSFATSYRSRAMYVKTTPKNLHDSDCFSFLDAIEKCKTLEPLLRDSSDKGVILPNENYIPLIDKGINPKNYFGLQFHSDKIFSRFNEEFKKGDIISFNRDGELSFGEVFGLLTNNQLLVRTYGMYHEVIVINSNIASLIEDVFVEVEAIKYALFMFDKYITHGKLVEENSTHYRFLVEWGDAFVRKIGSYYFTESIYYQNVSDEMEREFKNYPIDKMIITIKKDLFEKDDNHRFFNEMESKVIDDLMKSGLSKTEILTPFFQIIDKHDIQFHTVNLFLHCNIKLYGMDEALKKLFNDIPKYSQSNYETSRIINDSLTNLKKLSIVSS